MIFRIDIERYLTHAIDHFSRDDLANFQYLIVGTLTNNGRAPVGSVVKVNDLVPPIEIQSAFASSGDIDMLHKEYSKVLDESKSTLYKAFINPLLYHHNIVIICKEAENPYVDVIVEYLKKNFKIECIDLNKLFITGRVGPIYIDRAEIHNKAVDIRREAVTMAHKALESTKGGRLKLLSNMNTKNKIKKLREIGFTVTKADLKDLDTLLIENWVEDE